MKLKNKEIAAPTFGKGIEQLLKQEVTAKECMELSNVLEVLGGALMELDGAKVGILQRLAKKDEAGKIMSRQVEGDGAYAAPIFEDEASLKSYLEEVQALMEQEIEIPLSAKIRISINSKMTTANFLPIKSLVELV